MDLYKALLLHSIFTRCAFHIFAVHMRIQKIENKFGITISNY